MKSQHRNALYGFVIIRPISARDKTTLVRFGAHDVCDVDRILWNGIGVPCDLSWHFTQRDELFCFELVEELHQSAKLFAMRDESVSASDIEGPDGLHPIWRNR